MTRWLLFLLLSAPMLALEPMGTRMKELVSLEGVRDNQLIGYGLVVGLKKTGDNQQTLFSAQSLANLLQQMGVSINPIAIQVVELANDHVRVARLLHFEVVRLAGTIDESECPTARRIQIYRR